MVVLGLIRGLVIAALKKTAATDGIETDIASLEELLGDFITCQTTVHSREDLFTERLI